MIAGCAAKDCCVPRIRPEASWLACDDEIVKPISNEEFEDLLSAEPKMRSAATPYLLFYVKSEVGWYNVCSFKIFSHLVLSLDVKARFLWYITNFSEVKKVLFYRKATWL